MSSAILLHPVAPLAPPDRGPLLTAQQVAGCIGGQVSPAWVRRHVPHKVPLGHSTVRWFAQDVQRWLEERRQ